MTKIDGWNKETSPFHAGELEIQDRLGVRDKMDIFARRAVRAHMPDQHRRFYNQLPLIFAGHVDHDGWPWASILVGKPGFITSPDPRSLMIDATPLIGDPLAATLAPGQPLGLLGMEFSARRRNRVNGRITGIGDDGLRFAVDQAFGNCPQYIQTRAFEFARDPATQSPNCAVEPLAGLDDAARAMIQSADTFFVSSSSRNAGPETGLNGVDVSHRGGRPGFVKVDNNILTVPDYSGNFHFNTLGNLLVNPKAGLLFVDFESGDLLMLTGATEIIWDGPKVDAFRGAERAWRFTVDHGLRLTDALPIRWSFGEFSPNTLITGDWEEASATLAAEARRQEWRPHRVVRIEDESDVIRSFYLEPADGDGLFAYAPGQYLTLRATPEGADIPVIRTYTLSAAPADRLYRISVKREPARSETHAPGVVSNHLHDGIEAGDVIEARSPKGNFTLDTAETRPAVLLAGGVGITPMISMARQVAHEALRTRHARPLTIFHAARTTGDRAFYDAFRDLQRSTSGALRYISLISRPADGETGGVDFDATGYVTSDLLRAYLPIDDYDFFLCGPPAFMQAVYDILRRLGVRDARIFAEAFGPASLTRTPDAGAAVIAAMPEAEDAVVSFTKSGFDQRWNKGDAPLLDLAEAHGLSPEFGCRNGVCGTCAVKLKSGEVTYRTQPSAAHGGDEVLICCAVPAWGSERIEIDL